MAGQQSMPTQRRVVAAAAALVLLAAAWHSGPAIASSNTLPKCDDVAAVTLEIPTKELQATIVSEEDDSKEAEVVDSASEFDTSSATEDLVPGVEAVLRRVFEESTTRFAESDKQPAMNARVPGVSDDELARYKRQMYRIDI